MYDVLLRVPIVQRRNRKGLESIKQTIIRDMGPYQIFFDKVAMKTGVEGDLEAKFLWRKHVLMIAKFHKELHNGLSYENLRIIVRVIRNDL